MESTTNDIVTSDTIGPFVKSTFSDNSGNCVEVAPRRGGGGAVRDSKNREGGVLLFDAPVWAAFLGEVKRGTFG